MFAVVTVAKEPPTHLLQPRLNIMSTLGPAKSARGEVLFTPAEIYATRNVGGVRNANEANQVNTAL